MPSYPETTRRGLLTDCHPIAKATFQPHQTTTLVENIQPSTMIIIFSNKNGNMITKKCGQ